MSEPNADDIVHLASAANSFEANAWAQALREAGIRCKVVGDYLEVGLGNISNMRPEVWVHRDDMAQATDILRRHQARPDASAGDESQ
jgi:hypothetical protein